VWVNISELQDISAINEIRKNKIDIIIDIMGITSSSRISLFKNRLAPTQISWLGYCNTTGLNEVDYIIADSNLINKEEEDLYSEKVIFLPNIWNCHSGFNIERKLPDINIKNHKHITFGSFNNFNKISDEVVGVWSEILKKIDKSRLLLKSSHLHDIKILKEKFKKNGVIDSVVFSERKENFEDHLNLYQKIDIALDTFPYNGVTTSFEAIWMSVPVLTLRGFNFTSRCGESINKNINMEYLIANDENDYVLKAIELSEAPDKLLKMKKKLFENAPTSPLFNSQKFSIDFFKALEKIYYNL
jgi:protein O-GlcNAc transferase